MRFPYWNAPDELIDQLSKDNEICSLCGNPGRCFDLDYTFCPDLSDKEGKKGCLGCLRAGRFMFRHDTEIGCLSEKGLKKEYRHHLDLEWAKQLPNLNLDNLRKTPPFICNQQGLWLTHCQDFMVFIGIWDVIDFKLHSEHGDGKAQFTAMTDPSLRDIWPSILEESGLPLEKRSVWYYAFRCPHCNNLRGYWDCD